MRHNNVIVSRTGRATEWMEAYCLPMCLILQAALLFWRLDLLPVWGDEQFTLDTSSQALAGILEAVRNDIHPPLYYVLVHYWLHLPWSAALIVKARAFSGLWALAATVLLHSGVFKESYPGYPKDRLSA